jgi:hypothetical protein
MSIPYNDGTTEHSTNLERPRTDVAKVANLAALNAEIVLDLNGEASVLIDVRGTYVGTLNVQGTIDGLNYFDLPVLNQASQLWLTTLASAQVGAFIGNAAGLKRVRVRLTAYTSGSPTVNLRASLADDIVLAVPQPSTILGTNTAATGVAMTLTLPAPGLGLFHYLTHIRIQRHTSALLTAGATPLIVTTTNLPGSMAFSFEADASPQGVMKEQVFEPSQPLKSVTANTATTMVCPATTGVIWRATAFGYAGA